MCVAAFLLLLSIHSLTVTQSTQAIGVSDHRLQMVDFHIFIQKAPPKVLWVRSSRRCQWGQLRDSLHSVPWDVMTMLDDIDDKWEFFHQILMLSLDEFAPLHSVKYKKSKCATPWFSDLIALMIKEKHKARHAAERSGKDDNWFVFHRLKNQLKAAVRQAKVDYLLSARLSPREVIFSPNPMRWESHDLSVNYFSIVSCIIDIQLMIK